MLQLYRQGIGGERENAGRLLLAHLQAHDLTLYDLDGGLPVSRDLAAVREWRETASLVAQLGTAQQDEALSRLVDAPDLAPAELSRVLAVLDWPRLAELRAAGWAEQAGADPAQYLAALPDLSEADLRAGTGSVAARLSAALAQAEQRRRFPRRLIRTSGPIQTAFVLGLVGAVTGQPGRAQAAEGGVEAQLSAEQLARLRTLMVQHSAAAEERAYQAAQNYGALLS